MSRRRVTLASLAAVLGGALAAASGCSSQSPGSRVSQPLLPDTATFPYVGELLVVRCGTLDCHGSLYRNLRVFGDEGLRYAATDSPCVPQRTTATEFRQDYDSIVGLQPEVMNQVMADHGVDPERLDFLAKPLGLQAHKGLVLIHAGDDSYRCITSWLASHTDEAACLRALPGSICALPPRELLDGGAD